MNGEASTQTWPGAFGIYKKSKEAVMLNVLSILGLIALYILASIVISMLFGDGFISNLLGFIVGSAMTVALTLLILAGVRGNKMELTPTLKASVSMMTIKMALLSLLTGVIILGSLLLLIVPFFFIMPRLALAPYFLVDKKLGVFDSVTASWEATKGSIGKVWGIIGVSILFAIAIVVLVGIYLSIMYMAAFGLLYVHLAAKAKSAEAPSA